MFPLAPCIFRKVSMLFLINEKQFYLTCAIFGLGWVFFFFFNSYSLCFLNLYFAFLFHPVIFQTFFFPSCHSAFIHWDSIFLQFCGGRQRDSWNSSQNFVEIILFLSSFIPYLIDLFIFLLLLIFFSKIRSHFLSTDRSVDCPGPTLNICEKMEVPSQIYHLRAG